MWVDRVTEWLEKFSIEPSAVTQVVVALGMILVIAALLTHFILHRFVR